MFLELIQSKYRISSSKSYLFISVLFCFTTGCKEDIQPSKPNILLVMADDLGWFDVGFNGNPKIKTPNLDKLAKLGIVFNRFYSASSVCSPTRASVLTGRSPYRLNIYTANRGHMLTEEITLPELLKKEGYKTGHFGKWHLGTLTQKELDANRAGKEEFKEDYSIPTQHGYDRYFATESKVPTYDPMHYPQVLEEGESKRYGRKARTKKDSLTYYGTAYWSGEEEKVVEGLEGDDSAIITNRALPFIEESVKNKMPFFSTIWFHTPHLPLVSDSIHRNLYPSLSLREQLYNGAVTAMDEQIGRLWKKLEDLGVEDNTLIWFCSDNGPEVDTPGSAGNFRGRKKSLYEGGVRVPTFLVWKNGLKGGKRIDFPSITHDFLPTVLEFLGIEYPSDRPIDGENLIPAIKGSKKKRDSPLGFMLRKNVSWVNDTHKLISVDGGQTYELFNLIKDSGEKQNIIEMNREIADRMLLELTNWRNSVEMSAEGADY